jgi:hypothetical protein
MMSWVVVMLVQVMTIILVVSRTVVSTVKHFLLDFNCCHIPSKHALPHLLYVTVPAEHHVRCFF